MGGARFSPMLLRLEGISKSFGDRVLFSGVDLTLGADFFLSEDLYLNLRTGVTAYLYPFEETDLLNFPVLFQLGIGYAL